MLRTIKELREKIDRCDQKIIHLLNERFGLVSQIGKWKRRKKKPIYVPEREATLFKKISEYNKKLSGELSNSTLRSIYKEIMSGAIRLEAPIKVAYLGPEGTFSHQAVLKKFGESVETNAMISIEETLLSIDKGECHYAVIPIENSLVGSVVMTMDSLTKSQCKICSEFFLKVHHNLLSFSKPNEIKTIYSHPQALMQCHSFLSQNFRGVNLVNVNSTIEAVLKAKEEKYSAAIAGDLAIGKYNIPLVQSKIEDKTNNFTRFLVVGNQKTEITGGDKSSIFLYLLDKVGSLVDCLQVFRDNEINLTMIESRPSKNKSGEYYFFIDFLGHLDEPKIKKCLVELKEKSIKIKKLGSYPRAKNEY